MGLHLHAAKRGLSGCDRLVGVDGDQTVFGPAEQRSAIHVQVSLRAQRGTAMVESAIFMPLFLLILFGIIWAVQSSVQSERVQIAVRYGGFVSNEAAPY